MSTTRVRSIILESDIQAIKSIEHESFAHPWDDDDFSSYFYRGPGLGFVAEDDERIVGYLLYHTTPLRLHINSLAVSEKGRGIGRKLVERVKRCLARSKRNEIVTTVWERNLEAQVFFRSLGFRCVKIDHSAYESMDDAGYVFRFRANSFTEGNRIAKYYAEQNSQL